MRLILLFFCLFILSCKEKNKPKQHFPDKHIKQELTEENAIKFYGIGIEFGLNGELDKAKIAYEKALKFENSPIILNQLGIIESTLNNHKKSIEFYKKGKELDSLYFPVYIAEARSYGILNELDKAESVLIKLKELSKSEYWNSYADLYLAVIYYNRQENCSKIIEYLEKAKNLKKDIDLRKQYLDFEKRVKNNCG
jgi:tetratricopeptide (TPR) repeat protein